MNFAQIAKKLPTISSNRALSTNNISESGKNPYLLNTKAMRITSYKKLPKIAFNSENTAITDTNFTSTLNTNTAINQYMRPNKTSNKALIFYGKKLKNSIVDPYPFLPDKKCSSTKCCGAFCNYDSIKIDDKRNPLRRINSKYLEEAKNYEHVIKLCLKEAEEMKDLFGSNAMKEFGSDSTVLICSRCFIMYNAINRFSHKKA